MKSKAQQIRELLKEDPIGPRDAIAKAVGCSAALVSQVAKKCGAPDLTGINRHRRAEALLRELYEVIAYEGHEVEPTLDRVERFLNIKEDLDDAA